MTPGDILVALTPLLHGGESAAITDILSAIKPTN